LGLSSSFSMAAHAHTQRMPRTALRSCASWERVCSGALELILDFGLGAGLSVGREAGASEAAEAAPRRGLAVAAWGMGGGRCI